MASILDAKRPVPQADDLSRPFWDACNQERLVVQNCTACNRKQFPPEPRCYQCGSAEHLEWRETSGRGRIHGYALTNDSRIAAFHPVQPFNCAVIELEDDPVIKFLSNLPWQEVEDVPVGARVQVVFLEANPDFPGHKIPEWKVMP